MKGYFVTRCILGLIGSVVAIIGGLMFLVDGIKSSDPKGLEIGIPFIVAGLVGIVICIVMLKKANK